MNFNNLFVALIACAIFASIFSFARAEEAKEEDKAAHAKSEHVLVATDANFDELVNKYDTVFLEVYEQWCGHFFFRISGSSYWISGSSYWISGSSYWISGRRYCFFFFFFPTKKLKK